MATTSLADLFKEAYADILSDIISSPNPFLNILNRLPSYADCLVDPTKHRLHITEDGMLWCYKLHIMPTETSLEFATYSLDQFIENYSKLKCTSS